MDDFAHADITSELPLELKAGTVSGHGFQRTTISSTSSRAHVHRPGYAELAVSFNAAPRVRY